MPISSPPCPPVVGCGAYLMDCVFGDYGVCQALVCGVSLWWAVVFCSVFNVSLCPTPQPPHIVPLFLACASPPSYAKFYYTMAVNRRECFNVEEGDIVLWWR